MGFAQPENDDAGKILAARGQQIAKVEVEGQHNTILRTRFLKDLSVRQFHELLVTKGGPHRGLYCAAIGWC